MAGELADIMAGLQLVLILLVVVFALINPGWREAQTEDFGCEDVGNGVLVCEENGTYVPYYKQIKNETAKKMPISIYAENKQDLENWYRAMIDEILRKEPEAENG